MTVDRIIYQEFVKKCCLKDGEFNYKGDPSIKIYKLNLYTGLDKWTIEFNSKITGISNECYETLDDAIYDFCCLIFDDDGTRRETA